MLCWDTVFRCDICLEMDISSLSTSSIFFPPSSATELPLLKRSRIPLRYRCLSPVSINRGTSQPFLKQYGRLVHNDNRTKVLYSLQNGVPTIEASSMNEIYDALAERILPTAAAAGNPKLKYIVGLAGPPGAGKSTVASEVVKRVNKLWPQRASSLDSQVNPPDVAVVFPMDGFHLYRSQLDAMEDPEEAHARRGAPWTFAPTLLLECLKKLRNEGSAYAPSFDHGVGDPVEDDIFVGIQHKVIIVEGNYLLLDEGVWKDISSMFDEKWFIDINIKTAMERVLKRHISTGKPPDIAKWRIEYNDQPNAELIMKSKKNADLIIRSINF